MHLLMSKCDDETGLNENIWEDVVLYSALP